MSSSRSRPWVLFLGATLAISGGIYYHYFKRKDSLTNQTKKELKELGPVKKDASGRVTFDYVKAVYLIAYKAANDRFESTKVIFIKKRREILIMGDFEGHKKTLLEMLE